jgi:threonine/serine exporter ThrE
MIHPPTENTSALADALDSLLHFGTSMLRAGDTAFRVREWMGVIARAMGFDALSARVALGSIEATGRRGDERATLVREVAPPGINAWRAPRRPA